MQRVREILTGNYASFVSPDVDTQLRALFPGLPECELTAPEGWAPLEALPA